MARRAAFFRASFRAESLAGRVVTGLFLLTVLAAVLVLVVDELTDRSAKVSASRALAATWNVAGPVCPRLSAEAFRQGRSILPKVVEIWDTRIDRRFGDVDCFMVSPNLWAGDDFPSCQFTDPEVLRVVTDKGETYYRFASRPGHAQAATVSLPGGRPRCVQAARLRPRAIPAP